MNEDNNFAGLISAAVTSKMTPEFIEKEVNTRIDKLVVESIDRALRSYSDTGKDIERAVTESLRVSRIDLPSYGSTVCTILKAQIESLVSELVSGRLAADMEELLSLAPKQIKLSAIADEMRKEHESDDKWGEVITVMVGDSGHGSTWVYLDERDHYEMRDKFQCAHRLLVSEDGTIASATINQRPMKDLQHIGVAYGLAQKIRAWVACGTKIELDVESVCVSVGD